MLSRLRGARPAGVGELTPATLRADYRATQPRRIDASPHASAIHVVLPQRRAGGMLLLVELVRVSVGGGGGGLASADCK